MITFKNQNVKDFVDYCLQNSVSRQEWDELVDDFIDAWHENEGFGLTLEVALGLSSDEYRRFRADARELSDILIRKLPVSMTPQNYYDTAVSSIRSYEVLAHSDIWPMKRFEVALFAARTLMLAFSAKKDWRLNRKSPNLSILGAFEEYYPEYPVPESIKIRLRKVDAETVAPDSPDLGLDYEKTDDEVEIDRTIEFAVMLMHCWPSPEDRITPFKYYKTAVDDISLYKYKSQKKTSDDYCDHRAHLLMACRSLMIGWITLISQDENEESRSENVMKTFRRDCGRWFVIPDAVRKYLLKGDVHDAPSTLSYEWPLLKLQVESKEDERVLLSFAEELRDSWPKDSMESSTT